MSITLDLTDEITADVVRQAKSAGQADDGFILEALRRQLSVQKFLARRERLSEFGPRAGLNTDEEVFEVIS